MGVSGTKSLGLAGIAAAIITDVQHVATGGGHFAQILMGAGGVALYAVDHMKTIVGAFKSGPTTIAPKVNTVEAALMRRLDAALGSTVTATTAKPTVVMSNPTSTTGVES